MKPNDTAKTSPTVLDIIISDTEYAQEKKKEAGITNNVN